MTVDLDALTSRLARLLATPAGAAALQSAVAHVLALAGAPTRPDGAAEPLGERWRRGEPLAEDTDWRSPLGPFRDPDVQAGTLGELCAARLVAGPFAGDVLLERLVPFARAAAPDLLAPARDTADADAACVQARAGVVGQGWRGRPLAPLVGAATPAHGADGHAGPAAGAAVTPADPAAR